MCNDEFVTLKHMNNSYWRIANLILLLFGIFIISLGTFYKHISFGMGLGDLVGYFFMYLVVIIHGILTWKYRKRSYIAHLIMIMIFFCIWFFIVISATIGRGPEYRWNGKLFYGMNRDTVTIIKVAKY